MSANEIRAFFAAARWLPRTARNVRKRERRARTARTRRRVGVGAARRWPKGTHPPPALACAPMNSLTLRHVPLLDSTNVRLVAPLVSRGYDLCHMWHNLGIA